MTGHRPPSCVRQITAEQALNVSAVLATCRVDDVEAALARASVEVGQRLALGGRLPQLFAVAGESTGPCGPCEVLVDTGDGRRPCEVNAPHDVFTQLAGNVGGIFFLMNRTKIVKAIRSEGMGVREPTPERTDRYSEAVLDGAERAVMRATARFSPAKGHPFAYLRRVAINGAKRASARFAKTEGRDQLTIFDDDALPTAALIEPGTFDDAGERSLRAVIEGSAAVTRLDRMVRSKLGVGAAQLTDLTVGPEGPIPRGKHSVGALLGKSVATVNRRLAEAVGSTTGNEARRALLGDPDL